MIRDYNTLKFAHKISTVYFNKFGDDLDSTIKPDTSIVKFTGTTKIPTVVLQHLVGNIKTEILTDNDIDRTIKGLLSVINCVSHFMNVTSKESTVGGVIFMPLSDNPDGNLPQIGDRINLIENEGDIVVQSLDGLKAKAIAGIKQLGKGLADAVIRPLNSSELSIFKKAFYIWKIVYYFGGAGTNPSGTSGSTMRIYLTDSGIHWGSSHEENDITTQIAERLRITGLPNTFG